MRRDRQVGCAALCASRPGSQSATRNKVSHHPRGDCDGSRAEGRSRRTVVLRPYIGVRRMRQRSARSVDEPETHEEFRQVSRFETLIDSGPLVAYLVRNDRHNRWACDTLRTRPAPLHTCEAVLTESFHLLSKTDTGVNGLSALLRAGHI